MKASWIAAAVLFTSWVVLAQDAPDLSRLQANQSISVREGDAWSQATFLKREGRRYQVRYEDGTEEWVSADRLRSEAPDADAKPAGGAVDSAASKNVEKPKYPAFTPGQKVELKEGPNWSPVTIVNRRGDWYLVEYDKWNGWREWAEPWRLRKPGSDYDISGWGNRNPRVSGTQGPPRTTPGDAPVEGGKSADAFAAPTTGFPIADAVRAGREIVPVASSAWSVPASIPVASMRIPGSVTPTVLPPISGNSAKYVSVRLNGTKAMLAIRGEGSEKKSGLVKIDVMTNSVSGLEVNSASFPLDISPSGDLVLARSSGFFPKGKGRVDLYKIVDGKCEQVASFHPDAEKSSITDAAFIDEQHILTLAGGELACWDPMKATRIWYMPASGETIARSTDGKQIAVSTKDGVVILDPSAGTVLGMLDAQVQTQLSFSGDGKRLVGLQPPFLHVWDLEKGTPVLQMGLPQGVDGKLSAINSDHILIGAYLFSIPKMTVVWNYEGTQLAAQAGGRTWSIYNDGKKTYLTSAELPHPAAKDKSSKMDVAQLVMKPGVSVSLDIQAEVDDVLRQKIVTSLTRQLEAANIKVEENQPLRIVARSDFPTTTSREFRSGAGPLSKVENVSITSKKTTLGIELDGKPIWQTERTVSNDPGMIAMVRGDKSIQDAVNERKLDPEWLATEKIPTLLAGPIDLVALPKSRWALGGVKDQ